MILSPSGLINNKINTHIIMAVSNESEVDELQDVIETEGDESTDWQEEHKKLTEKAIRARERNKALRDTLKAKEAELEALRKPTTQPEKNESKADDSKLLEKLERLSLRTAGIDHPDDIELARNTAKKWNMDIDEVLADEDFKVKLERQQTTRANAVATSNIRGGAGTSQAKNTPEYWIAKGVPPTADQVPDRKTRAKIARAMMGSNANGKKFYND